MVELGRALKDARLAAKLTQAEVGALAGVVQGTVSEVERGTTATLSHLVLARMAKACGSELHAYLQRVSGAQEPRDIAHLRTQALIASTAEAGGWQATPEAAIEDAAERSRSIAVLLARAALERAAVELAIVEVLDWLPDVGASLRSWDRRLARVERWAIATRTRERDGATLVPRVSGCWVLRATKRNRQLVRELRPLFAARFQGVGRDWIAALGTDAPMPASPALLWVSVKADRLWPVRL
jgi:transcriptional regulator with XRE-family HTH domain